MGALRVPIDMGQGPDLVILPGYAMTPATYAETAARLADRCRVLVPDLYSVRGPWRYPDILGRFVRALDQAGVEQASLVGHSFGGGIELGFAARYPERVTELVFADTLALSREWTLAAEALSRPVHLLRLATRRAAVAFFRNWATHPRQLAGAAWWGFTSARADDVAAIAEAGLPAHVLWASRDSLLDRRDGRRFAQELNATFTVAAGEERFVDHDWMFRHPEFFVAHLHRLGLRALARPR